MSTAARLPLCPADRSTGTQCSPAVPDGVGALILDFDGVLADTVGRHEAALRAALRPYGVDLTPAGTAGTSACPSTTSWRRCLAAGRCPTTRSSSAAAGICWPR
ncbi:hypothetical protein [Streptomyces sp. C8S0]|uniref:hypothetical protein n=1 Tax=Streptomyces sp. C8S0 TaxID=2585716 RepID=UPI001D035FD4|nr:hypothetical protein [Streptomyces sp. C8S0]